MRRGKHVFNIGRLRVAVMHGGRYRFGFDLKRASWAGERPIGFTAGIGVAVVSTLWRNR
jgi:hypothetical protein